MKKKSWGSVYNNGVILLDLFTRMNTEQLARLLELEEGSEHKGSIFIPLLLLYPYSLSLFVCPSVCLLGHMTANCIH